MKHLKMVTATALLLSVLLVFNMNVSLRPTPTIHSVFQKSPPLCSNTSAPPAGRRRTASMVEVSISDEFRRSIPHTWACWNRLLLWALKSMDEAGAPFIPKIPPWSDCVEMYPNVLKKFMWDYSIYPVMMQNFLYSMSCRFAPMLIDQPAKCPRGGREKANRSLLFAIKSTPSNFAQRQAIRDTWGREEVYGGWLQVRTVFLLGTSADDPDIDQLLTFEAGRDADILQWDFQESLLNLTMKMTLFLQWALATCPDIDFVFSGDDDVFVNTPVLVSFLRSLDLSQAPWLYMGHIIENARPYREMWSKYYIPWSFFDGVYPTYAGGGGFLISGNLLGPLYTMTFIIPPFPIDDVYIGICCKALGVVPRPHAGFHTFDIKEQANENPCIYRGLVLVHRRSPQQLKRLWRRINSILLKC